MQLHSNRLEAPRNVTVYGNGKFKMKYISINLQNRPSYFAVNKKKTSKLIPVSKKRRSLQ